MNKNVKEEIVRNAIVMDLMDGFFKVSTPFDSSLVEFYRSLPNKKWCSEHKYWRFPIDKQIDIEGELNRRGYTVIHKSFRPVVHIREMDGNEAEVSSKYDLNIYQILHAVPGNRWDPISDAFIIPNSQITTLINDLNTKDIAYDYTRVIQEARANFGKPTKSKFN